MAPPPHKEAACSGQIAEDDQRLSGSRRDGWRPCPATRHLHPDHRTVCPNCTGKTCERMQAKGIDDSGNPLPPHERPACGAKTRAGGSCRHPVIPGMTRCRYHGGKSTGPRTPEGKARIADAQRKRWAKWRAVKG